MPHRYLYLILAGYFLLLNVSCQFFSSPNDENKALSAQEIIEKAIENAGGESFFHAQISFDFRDKKYTTIRNGGWYEYQRIFSDSANNEVRDVLNNKGLQRFVADVLQPLPDSTSEKYKNSLNSVIYFASLPFLLNDEAVIAKKLAPQKLKNKDYYKIEVRFKEKNGGTDFQDVFIYWFDKTTFQMDYFAYQYHTDGGGVRFREAYNVRKIEGLTFADFHNYKPADKNVKLTDIDQFFEVDQLILLSEIQLNNVAVLHTKP